MSSCIKPSDNYVLADNVILHILVLFTVVSAMFYFLISKITEDHVNHEFEGIIDQIVNTNDIKKFVDNLKRTSTEDELRKFIADTFNIEISGSNKINVLNNIVNFVKENIINKDIDFLKQKLNRLVSDYKKNPHLLREQINKDIITQIIGIVIFLCIISAMFNLLPILISSYCQVLTKLTIELVIVFAFVGYIEYWFFNNVGLKYIPVKPDLLTKTFKKFMTTEIIG